MPGREQIPSYHLATGTTDQIDYCYNITPGCIVYNTDTSDVVIYGEDLEITGNFMIKDISVNNMEISGNLNLEYNIFDTSVVALAGGIGGLTGTGGVQGIASSNSDYDVSNSPIKAFNGTLVDNDDCWESLDNLPAYPKSLIFEFPYDVIVTKYSIWPKIQYDEDYPTTWTLRAYKAGSSEYTVISDASNYNWSNPDTESIDNDAENIERYVSINHHSTGYRKFELHVTSSNSEVLQVAIGELAFYGYKILSVGQGSISARDISAEVVSANDISVRGGGNISGNFSIVRNIYVDINTTTRSTSSWTYYPLPDAWPTRTYRGGSRLHVFYAVPLRNDDSGWGGCYTKLYYKINNGTEYSLGDGGYTDVMTNGAQHIAVHHRTFFLDFSHNDTNVDFSCQFIPKNRPYRSTLKTNTNTNHGTGDANPYYVETKQNYAKMIITEYGPNS